MIGNLKVRRAGQGPTPIILMPGLGCGPWIFDGLNAILSRKYSIYSVTVAGFDGVPAVAGPLIDGITSSVSGLVETEALTKPAIVAHSIGGTVALEMISRFPNLFGAAVIIDAAPRFLSSLESLEDRREANSRFAEKVFRSSSLLSAESSAREWVSEMVNRQADADRVLSSWERSDRSTMCQFLVEGRMLAFKLNISQIQCPVCVIAPFEQQANRSTIESEFTEAYRQRPDFEIHLVGPARHFVMLDKPEETNEVVNGFLSSALSENSSC
jgi:pimeloyl-ACP methyl ester carboxylesterase